MTSINSSSGTLDSSAATPFPCKLRLNRPSLPNTADEIFHQLNTENRFNDSLDNFDGLDIGIKLNEPKPIFERINVDEKYKEINELINNV